MPIAAPVPGLASLAQPASSPALTPASGPASTPASEANGEADEAPPPGEPPAVPHVQVTAVEYAYMLSRTSVPAGKVALEFVNSGQDPHNLNLTSPAGPSEEPVANTAAKGVVDVTLQLAPGSYTLYCSLPTHEQKGMKATLTVQ